MPEETASPPYLESVELAADENSFSFELAALSFRRPDKNRFAYRLEGLEEQWVEAGSRRFASYTSVPPGDYVFRARAANADGVWNEQGASVRIKIAPPLWARWWAYLLYAAAALALLGALAAAHRYKVGQEREINRHLRRIDQIKDDFLAERDQLIGELEARNADLARINYTVSHDLKNPVVTIKNYLGLLQRDAATYDTERLLGEIGRLRRAADQMHLLLEELHQYSRISYEVSQPVELALADVAHEAKASLAGRIAESAAEVKVADDLPTVEGDRSQLREVFKALLDNALKFHGGKTPRIEIGARRDTGICYIRDHGIGIEPRYHDKVFELFDRLNPDIEGTGLGLALAKRIVESHGGRIWVESRGTGTGSTFCFSLA